MGAYEYVPPLPTELVDSLIQQVEESGLSSDHQDPLLDSLLAAYASFARDSWGSGVNQLKAFQNKIAAQMASKDEELAEGLTEAAQEVIEWVQVRANLHIKRNGPKTLLH